MGYDKEPTIEIKGHNNHAWEGYENIVSAVKKRLTKDKNILTIETYPGTRKDEILQGFSSLNFAFIIDADDFTLTPSAVETKIKDTITEDRVFGTMSRYTIDDFIIKDKLEESIKKLQEIKKGNILIHGFGASKVCNGDIFIYADLARWEIQKRYRSQEIGNWKTDNKGEDPLKKYKQGFFFEWRMADRLKKDIFSKIDYLLDTNMKDSPKMVTGEAIREGLGQIVKRPFRLVPYFDPGVWGGQWMKENFDLPKNEKNFAWSFDGVPEENSLYLKFGDIRIEIPAINLVFFQTVKLLGNKVHARFGCEFPIRFDFLDTMGGGNLSLQVHPLTEYIQDKFGMPFTQDESYYMLDTAEETYVYLGLKSGINKDDMIKDLNLSSEGKISFPSEKYINKIRAKKHDHFSIPAGTIHCSGAGSLVLEISATPYIFTFKLWDWDRVGLDGKPRPTHPVHGEKNICWDRTEDWVEKNLKQVTIVEEGEGYREEKTGLHERQFIETRRHWFSEKVSHNTQGSVNMLNLVEGKEAIVESPTAQFEPFIVRYAETFIIPEDVKEYTIRPYGKSEGKEIATIKAFVRV